jgi:hypothetical protein
MSRAGRATLERKLEKLLAALSRSQAQEPEITFVTYWGDEQITLEPGDTLFRTEWGSGSLESESEQEGDSRA